LCIADRDLASGIGHLLIAAGKHLLPAKQAPDTHAYCTLQEKYSTFK
jgi:hypothetical protein